MIKKNTNLFRDLGIIVTSIIAAVILAQTGSIDKIFYFSNEFKALSSFLAGIFFISIFTVAPATVFLVKIMQTDSLFLVSFFAALGGVVGDLIIFTFVKGTLTDDLVDFIRPWRKKWWRVIFHLHRFKFKWFLPILGAIIIASPLPDELGLSLLGFSKIKTRYFISLSFVLNFLGIMVIGLIVKSVMP